MRAFIIHGWGGNPLESWKPWLASELTKSGFLVKVPAMPNAEHPRQDEWVKALDEAVGQPTKDCFFIGHSLGCIAILRYLESIQVVVGGAVLIAGFARSLGIPELDNFFTEPIDWKRIRNNCFRFTAINSDDDPYVPVECANAFLQNLGATCIIEHGMKHFGSAEGITQVPMVLREVLKMVRN